MLELRGGGRGEFLQGNICHRERWLLGVVGAWEPTPRDGDLQIPNQSDWIVRQVLRRKGFFSWFLPIMFKVTMLRTLRRISSTMNETHKNILPPYPCPPDAYPASQGRKISPHLCLVHIILYMYSI